MSCWTLLGLPATADTRTIKRHYAKLLKQTRPDEDPQGFQRLRDAYEEALAHKDWEQQNEPLETPETWAGNEPVTLALPETNLTFSGHQRPLRPLRSKAWCAASALA